MSALAAALALSITQNKDKKIINLKIIYWEAMAPGAGNYFSSAQIIHQLMVF